MNKLVPMFKQKYNIEKMTFITLTDGGANSNYGTETIANGEKGFINIKNIWWYTNSYNW
jgi:hypothetical protein